VLEILIAAKFEGLRL